MKRLAINKALEDYSRVAITVNELIDSLWWIDPLINNDCGTIEPPASYRKDGKLAYANGTGWNPGSGKGVYRYNGDTSAWVLVG